MQLLQFCYSTIITPICGPAVFFKFISRPGKIRQTNLSGFYFPCDLQNSIVALNVKWGVKLWAPQRDFVFQGSLSASLLGWNSHVLIANTTTLHVHMRMGIPRNYHVRINFLEINNYIMIKSLKMKIQLYTSHCHVTIHNKCDLILHKNNIYERTTISSLGVKTWWFLCFDFQSASKITMLSTIIFCYSQLKSVLASTAIAIPLLSLGKW